MVVVVVGVGVGQSARGTVHAAGESAVFTFRAGLGALRTTDASDCARPGDGRFVRGRTPAFHAVDGASRGRRQSLFLFRRRSIRFNGFVCECGGCG